MAVVYAVALTTMLQIALSYKNTHDASASITLGTLQTIVRSYTGYATRTESHIRSANVTTVASNTAACAAGTVIPQQIASFRDVRAWRDLRAVVWSITTTKTVRTSPVQLTTVTTLAA